MLNRIITEERHVTSLANRPVLQNPYAVVDRHALRLDYLSRELNHAYEKRFTHENHQMERLFRQLKESMRQYFNKVSYQHTTITVYLLTLMFLAGRAATDELQGEASIQVPVNMRKFYPSKTVRNFSMYCGIRMPIEETTDVQSIIVKVDEQLQKKASKESMDAMLMATVRLVKFLKYIPLILKQRVAKVVYGFLGDKIFTNTLSNLGVINVPPAMAEHIESMDTVMGPPITNRASCSVITMNDIATFSITKTTFDPTFEEAMYDLLLADGISITVEGSDFYEA